YTEIYNSVYMYIIYLFSVMIRQPPISTLFPSRRSSDLKSILSFEKIIKLTPSTISIDEIEINNNSKDWLVLRGYYRVLETFDGRSEEHTSELQSRENLVCRLLLEKKKNQIKINMIRNQK